MTVRRHLILLACFVLMAALMLTGTACKRERKYPNVIVISVDTLRADRVGAYGSDRGITGMMDFWARRGVTFTNAYAAAPWTLPSHASAFTGLYSTEHMAIDEKISIDKAAPMLAEEMKKAGLKTGAFVAHYYLSAEYGFDRGFDDFFIKPNATADEMVTKATNWLHDNKDENFFLFLHLFDPHTPYTPPPDLAKKHYPSDAGVKVNGTTADVMSVMLDWPSDHAQRVLRVLSALYDGEVDFVDNQLEVLFKAMQEEQLDQNTIIVLFSDHGEEFMEHGMMEHGFTLYEEQLRVPFIWYYPAKLKGGLIIDEPVSLVDMMPTLLDLLGLPPVQKPISGRSLTPLWRGEAHSLGRYVLAETTRQGPDRAALIKDRYKYIYSPPFELNGRKLTSHLFHLTDDPSEVHDLLATDAPRAENLRSQLFSSGLYVERRLWHVRWAGLADTMHGVISTTGKVAYVYKANTIYGTDERGLLISREYPLDKTDPAKLQFVTLRKEPNGVSFMTDPETAPVSFQLRFDSRPAPARVCLGNPGRHPDGDTFTLNEPVALLGPDTPPAGAVLIWSEPVWVNSRQVLRAEVGDPIKLSPEVIEQLRSLGYLTQ